MNEDFETLKRWWDNLESFEIDWDDDRFSDESTQLINVIIGSILKEGSVYISVNDAEAHVIYDEFDFNKRLTLIYNSNRNVYSIDLFVDGSEDEFQQYKYVLNASNKELLPSRLKTEMEKAVKRGESIRIDTFLLDK